MVDNSRVVVMGYSMDDVSPTSSVRRSGGSKTSRVELMSDLPRLV